MKKVKFIPVNELQSQISQIIRETQNGSVYKIVRYSKPVAVLMNADYFDKLVDKINELQGECKSCIQEFRKIKENK